MDLTGLLNEEQLAAALDTEGAVLVTAGAGSGKTRLLTYRIAYLITEKNVSPFSILAITFTNKAANEMKNRIEGIVPSAGDIWVSTFHSMCAKMLRRDATRMGYSSSFTIYDTDDCERILKKICKDLKITDEKFYKKAWEVISDAKTRGISAAMYEAMPVLEVHKSEYASVFKAYEEKLLSDNAMDFDDLLIKCLQLLLSNEDVLKRYQNKFRYVLVDEFQDTNKIQYELVKLLCGYHGNVFVVGDEDQSIYSWRGADFTNMKRFIEEFGAKVYKLEQNYRSTRVILNAANSLIKNNEERIEKKLWTNNESGEAISVISLATDKEEADIVARKILEGIRAGKQFHDYCVLMRINALSRLFEERFFAYGIPYKIHGGFRFFDRKEVKDLIAYIRVIVNPRDEDSLERIVNFPRRNIGDASLAQVKAYSRLNEMTLFDTIVNIEANLDLPKSLVKKFAPFSRLLSELTEASKMMNLDEFTMFVAEKSGMKLLYSLDESEENKTRLMNIGQFISFAVEYCEKNDNPSIDTFLQEVALYSEGDDEGNDNVFISTVHSAKGMEFDTVFVVGLEDDIFPMYRQYDSEKLLEEERRLMYVAITRAKRKLYLTYSNSRMMYGQFRYSRMSHFLTEIDPSLKPPERIARPLYGSEDKASSFFGRTGGTVPQKPEKQEKDVAKYKPGARVKHKKFGLGTVVEITGTSSSPYIKINFDDIGVIQLALNFAPVEIVGE